MEKSFTFATVLLLCPHSTTCFPKNGKIYYCTRRLRSCLIAQSSRPLQHQLWASVLQTLNHQTVDYLSVTSQVLLKRVTQPPSAGEQLVTSTLRSTPPPHPDERRRRGSTARSFKSVPARHSPDRHECIHAAHRALIATTFPQIAADVESSSPIAIFGSH